MVNDASPLTVFRLRVIVCIKEISIIDNSANPRSSSRPILLLSSQENVLTRFFGSTRKTADLRSTSAGEIHVNIGILLGLGVVAAFSGAGAPFPTRVSMNIQGVRDSLRGYFSVFEIIKRLQRRVAIRCQSALPEDRNLPKRKSQAHLRLLPKRLSQTWRSQRRQRQYLSSS